MYDSAHVIKIREVIGQSPSGLAVAITRGHPDAEKIFQVQKVHSPDNRHRLMELCIHTSDVVNTAYGLPEALRRLGVSLKERFPSISHFHVGLVMAQTTIENGRSISIPEHCRLALYFQQS